MVPSPAGQRWKVKIEGGAHVRSAKEICSLELPSRLPTGAIVEELELDGEALHFRRISPEGPLYGWASIKGQNGEITFEKSFSTKRKAAEPAPTQQPLGAQSAKIPASSAGSLLEAGGGRSWQVVAQEGLVVRKGHRLASHKLPERLPFGATVEELEVVGDRLHFSNTAGVGPASGWVSLTDKGQELLQKLAEPSDPATSFESLKRGFLSGGKAQLYPEAPHQGEGPLTGWAELAKLYEQDLRELAPPGLAAAAAETAGRRRRAVREELPSIDDLENMDEASLKDLLDFTPEAAKSFADLSRAEKRGVIADAKFLLEASTEKRLDILDKFRHAWPKGPFPEITPGVEELALLPPGSCFPFSRHLREVAAGPGVEWGLEAAANKAMRNFFTRRVGASSEAQKEFLRSMKCEVTCTAAPVRAEAAAVQPEPCRLPGPANKQALTEAIMMKNSVDPNDVLKYFNAELKNRICLLDGSISARLKQENLVEADYRGERFKNFKETDSSGKAVALQGNLELLVLTKANLVVEAHKEYLKAGADIIRTNTMGCNATDQAAYKMNKLVYEMNKSAAQLAKKAAFEVTKQEPQKPRFVAGVLGLSGGAMTSNPLASWSSTVEAYSEQLKGLVDGGVDILMLDGVADSLNAKAAVVAIEDYFEKTSKVRMPLIITAELMAGGRTASGQSAEAFCISVKHTKPMAMGLASVEGPNQLKFPYGSLAALHLGWCSACPGTGGVAPEDFATGLKAYAKDGLLNFAGGGPGALPAHIAAVAKQLQDMPQRALPRIPEDRPLQLAGLDAIGTKPEEGFHVIGSQCSVMGSQKFKKHVGAFKATGKSKYLQDALEVCHEQTDKGADLLDFNLDSDLANGPACPAKGTMGTFMQLAAAEPKVAKVPFMLCSCEWGTIEEGLRRVQGKCIVNGLSVCLGDEEFLRIAKKVKGYGAALVVLAVTDGNEPAEAQADKVRICRRSYELLRTKLDFPAEDIIFDCQALPLGLSEFATRATDFIGAVQELKQTCPCASFIAGINNLSLPFRGLNMLRDALHSVFLHQAIPKGLNLAIAWPGALPIYSDIDEETRALCEEVVLNKSRDAKHLERFNAFVNFGSNSLACLPVQKPSLSKWKEDEEGHWWKSSAVQKESKETQSSILSHRKKSSPQEQKRFLKSLELSVICNAEPLKADPGAGLPDTCRLDGYVNRDQLTRTVVAQGGVRIDDLAKYLNAELRGRVCVLATPKQSDYKEYFEAGCDICGTNTLSSTSYEESKAAAQLARSAAAEVTKKGSNKPRFVAGLLGPTSHSLSSSSGLEDPSLRSATWKELVAAYTEQVRGLVEGGVDLLAIEMVSDTLNAKAAIYALDGYFLQTKKERLPLFITAVVNEDGRMPCGQSIEAFVVSVKHARPFSVGITGALDSSAVKEAMKALAGRGLMWCHAIGTDPSSLAALANEKVLNFAGLCGLEGKQITEVAGKVEKASVRPLPAVPRTPALELSGLEVYAKRADDGMQIVGQRCSMNGSTKFKGLIDAYKYTKGGKWEAALNLCTQQCEAGADLLDFSFDSEFIDSKWAMGKFMRQCATDTKVARVPFMLSSAKWPVIEEGLQSVQGKCIVNAISLVQGQEEFLRLAKACLRYGAAVVVMPLDSPESWPSVDEKVDIGQKAYRLLRTKLDFPAEEIIFDCNVVPTSSGESPMAFMDTVAKLKRSCPHASFIGGVSGLSVDYREVPLLRDALHSTFLYHAVPMGLNMAIVDPGKLPCFTDIEAQTKKVCEDVITSDSSDDSQLQRLESYADYLSGGAAVEMFAPLAAQTDAPMAIPLPKRRTPGFSQNLHTLVQGTGTINASLFQTFGSKSHTATIFHKTTEAVPLKREVWFSSISAWMGQGGSGPITGASSLMDCLSLYERWMELGIVANSVEWGAIGEIGLRRTVYGSRDVFAQFDLGQKLIGPADTQILMRAICVGKADPYEVVAQAYLDQTWQMTLAGVTSGGGLERKTFADM